jgi:hypothetical protein
MNLYHFFRLLQRDQLFFRGERVRMARGMAILVTEAATAAGFHILNLLLD